MHILEKRNNQINNVSFHLRKQESSTQSKQKKRKSHRVDINGIENKKSTEKQKTKACFLKRNHKIDMLLAKLRKKR